MLRVGRPPHSSTPLFDTHLRHIRLARWSVYTYVSLHPAPRELARMIYTRQLGRPRKWQTGYREDEGWYLLFHFDECVDAMLATGELVIQ